MFVQNNSYKIISNVITVLSSHKLKHKILNQITHKLKMIAEWKFGNLKPCEMAKSKKNLFFL